jgi:hypothetical protein
MLRGRAWGRARLGRERSRLGPVARAHRARPVSNAKRSDLAGTEPGEGGRRINRWWQRRARSGSGGQHRPQREGRGCCHSPCESGARMKRAMAAGCDLDARRTGLRRARLPRTWRSGRGTIRRAAGHRGRRSRGTCSGETSDAADRTGKDEREQHCRNLAHRVESLAAPRSCGNPPGPTLGFILRERWTMT